MMRKSAVDMQRLYRAMQRVPNLRMTLSRVGPGGRTHLTQPQIEGRLDAIRDDSVATSKELRDLAAGLPSNIRDGLEATIRDLAAANERRIQRLRRSARGRPFGRIDAQPVTHEQRQAAEAMLNRQRPWPARVFGFGEKPKLHDLPDDEIGRKAEAALIGAHESFERRVPRRDIRIFTPFQHTPLLRGHGSPEVLMKEHNGIERARGQGSSWAVGSLRGLRKATGESEALRDLFVRTYGPRAGQFFEEGSTIPRAMRRDMMRRLRSNPKLLEKQAVSLSAFADELEKIAKEDRPRQQSVLVPALAATAADSVARTGATVAHGLYGRRMKPLLERPDMSEAAYGELIPKLHTNMGIQQGLFAIPRMEGAPASGYLPPGVVQVADHEGNTVPGKYHVVVNPPGNSALAHEMGHARSQETRLGRLLQKIETTPKVRAIEFGLPPWLAHNLSPGFMTGAVGGTMAALADPDSTASKVSPYVAAAGSVPLLAEEAGASVRGYQGLVRSGVAPEVLSSYRRKMLAGFGAHAGLTAVPVLGAVAARYVRKRMKRKEQERK